MLGKAKMNDKKGIFREKLRSRKSVLPFGSAGKEEEEEERVGGEEKEDENASGEDEEEEEDGDRKEEEDSMSPKRTVAFFLEDQQSVSDVTPLRIDGRNAMRLSIDSRADRKALPRDVIPRGFPPKKSHSVYIPKARIERAQSILSLAKEPISQSVLFKVPTKCHNFLSHTHAHTYSYPPPPLSCGVGGYPARSRPSPRALWKVSRNMR